MRKCRKALHSSTNFHIKLIQESQNPQSSLKIRSLCIEILADIYKGSTKPTEIVLSTFNLNNFIQLNIVEADASTSAHVLQFFFYKK